jgi:hypothetical protein
MSEEMPEIIVEPSSAPGARALASRERATSRSCLEMMYAAMDYIKSRACGVQEEEEEELAIGRSGGDRTADKTPLKNSAQLASAFLAVPADVLGAGCYAMTASAAFLQTSIKSIAQLAADERDGPDYYLIKQEVNATVGFYAKHPSYPGARHIEVEEAGKEGAPKMYFLPWEDSKLTYCKLENDARLVLTGPLNGCSVFVVEVTDNGKDTYLFHVNANVVGNSGYAEAQRAKLDAALSRLWPDSSKRTLTHRLDFSGYGPPSEDVDVSAEAIVYGTRRGSGEWEFFYYVIDVDRAGRCTRRGGTPDPLPREPADD